ncbi:MAG TPA: dephospho-CoA kinase, partial [Bacteroidales bacterium]|nr:dephospho-CoA kinase [Bacteroidales bacterium]
MIRVGLTGNIGSGKSTVGRIFEVLGAPVFHADASGRSVMMRDDVKHAIARHFGDHLVDGTGQIDRKALAGIVFNHPEGLAWLNALIHPLVLEEYRIWHARQDAPYTI